MGARHTGLPQTRKGEKGAKGNAGVCVAGGVLGKRDVCRATMAHLVRVRGAWRAAAARGCTQSPPGPLGLYMGPGYADPPGAHMLFARKAASVGESPLVNRLVTVPV